MAEILVARYRLRQPAEKAGRTAAARGPVEPQGPISSEQGLSVLFAGKHHDSRTIRRDDQGPDERHHCFGEPRLAANLLLASELGQLTLPCHSDVGWIVLPAAR